MWFQKTKTQKNKVLFLKTTDDRKKEQKFFLEYFKELAEIALKLTTVGGLIIGLSQIHIQLSTQRKDQVMQLFLKQYEEEDNISKIRSSLDRDFELSKAYTMLDELKKKYPNGTKEDVLAVKREYANFIKGFIYENNNRHQEILILTNFYDGIAACVKSNLCDQESAKFLFYKEGNEFFWKYRPFFSDFYDKSKYNLINENLADFYELKSNQFKNYLS